MNDDFCRELMQRLAAIQASLDALGAREQTLLDVHDIAQRLRCSVRIVRKLMKEGFLTARTYPGLGLRFSEADWERYLATGVALEPKPPEPPTTP